MKLTSFAQSLHDLNLLKDQGFQEVILGHKETSRFGKLSDEELKILAARARELGLRVILEWDILMTEEVFRKVEPSVREQAKLADAIRVQDPGAFNWVLNNTKLPVQFIAENGNHNLEALQGWAEYAQRRMERIVLSMELSKEAIKNYVQNLQVPCELLGFGRILLFYTPRSLLSPLKQTTAVNGEISALGSSEESPHKGFPLVENRHGTFMFHIKEFCLLEFARELKEMGLSFFRIDLRWEGQEHLKTITSLSQNFDQSSFETFKQVYPQDLMRGFYLVNKTDVLFPKLKNSRLQSRQGNYVGEVMEAEKGAHLAIMVRNPQGLKRTDKLKILHPKGEIFELPIYSLKNSSLEEVEVIPAQSLALIPFVGGVWVKSQVFYLS